MTRSFPLTDPHTAQDLEDLGLAEHRATILAAADPHLALNNAVRLKAALGRDYEELRARVAGDALLRVRLFSLLGGSTALSDHLVANPHEWRQLGLDLPTPAEAMRTMLGCVEARPVRGGSAELTAAGTYLAGARFEDRAEAKAALKMTYRTLIMRVAAADLAGTYPLPRSAGEDERVPMLGYDAITGTLTACADAALTAALAVAHRVVFGDAEADCSLAVIAMGKCGARELNYISDVDVIFVAEPASATATKLASELITIGSACFFDVDANLRPEGKSGALVRTLDSHLAYYTRWAETWEFQALLKARPMTGDLELAKAYIDALAPLVWGASQRDSFVEDVQAMRRRVLDNVPADMRQRELKLGQGGLRDVEFAVQLLQLVHGRFDKSLRQPNTVRALEELMAGGYVGREDGASLSEAYGFLRLLEHRLQLQRFKRTHSLPEDDDEAGRRWLARAAGFTPEKGKSATERMDATLRKLRKSVSQLHERLFYRPLLGAVVGLTADEAALTPEAVKTRLGALGYRHPERAYEHLSALAKGSSRKAKLQAILLPTLMTWLGDTADPGAGLLNYRKLSEAAKGKKWFLRTLRDEGVVGQRLMHILGTSPYTADLIISAPDVVPLLGDGSAGPKLLEAAPDQVYKAILAATKRHEDPDQAVSIARALRRAELARIAAADLLGFMDVRQVCMELTWVWDAVLEAALRAEVRADLLVSGEAEPKARIAVIGMGRLGGAELGYGSDADVMIVAEPCAGTPEPEALAWATKIVDAMRSRLSKPSGDPPLEVDLGLRPEGRSGAVVRTIASYERYYRQWGEVWEKQALLRATDVAGDSEVGVAFLHAIDPYRYPEGGPTRDDVREIRRIKARVDDERLPRGADRATHTKLGRGGLADVEWTVQLLTMMHAHSFPQLHNTSTLEVLDFLEELDNPDVIRADQARTLREAWLAATNARNALVLVSGKRTDQLPAPGPQLAQVAGSAGYAPEDQQQFLEDYLRITRRAHRVVEEIFWGEAPSLEFD
ncbi:bifunctional [glutamine synthetase] adenylyltransferase/[glutamine synthetase]-adenylyl-L-tyrosine phosphorylase [Corynebacterium liangguodongii]|uniref:Bifunctional glutamine synthetase adenylyltransferase/adenylyl-removing enzyme n=1 Tax=Corynebacterium liangguodongii TaxID=2079535 RepID=A0A2S0WFA4_9CORY|nr:bifunctional [glutamine synthetase] adenylyltransferase/[glutamine synthetase]-adenylyl-L-tyrosine phosphorylase [Corynebacterium liangguodongii]AWB84404.1 bifunctional glutamine-synthetase adenylyltransferase/deadenyltransferase [Corynebacterium liangguodongii]PWB99894.1 bifunctional glutamine-synthetase adenylyltransferase/deadenyltransferase [Corynebacterium liangguodongii]